MSDFEIINHRDKCEAHIKGGLKKALQKAGAIVEREAKINVSQSGSNHPQVQTGELRSSISHETQDDYVLIGTNVLHGKYLELGHPDGSRHYPWLMPAAEAKRDEIKDLFKDVT